jgi:sulfotransferase family protein
MIVYLATYPRSGAAVLRSIVSRNWGYATTTDAPIDESPLVKKYRWSHAPTPQPGFSDGLWWGEGTCVYQARNGEWRRGLRAPGMRWLTPKVRSRLAAEPGKFFVKTHNFPFETYFPGEMAIQMVRHPGAAVVSLWKLQRDFFKRDNRLTDIICGRSTGGPWSEYHLRWGAAPLPKLRLSYEEAFADQASAVVAVGKFLGEPLPETITVVSLQEATAANPVRNPGAGIDGWREAVSADELALLRELHGETARHFGYDFPSSAPRRDAMAD